MITHHHDPESEANVRSSANWSITYREGDYSSIKKRLKDSSFQNDIDSIPRGGLGSKRRAVRGL